MDFPEFTLKKVEVSKIRANPRNPRGIDILQEDRKFDLLKDSISEFGILVPLVVTPEDHGFLLVDGERRYLAAKALGMKKVPAYITGEPLSQDQIIVRMFHIHHNLEQWTPIPQCQALEPRYKRILGRIQIQRLENEDSKVRRIAKALAAETGIEQNLAEDRVLFLRWPEDIKRELYKRPNKNYLYITEIEKHIILPALKNYPEYFEKVPVDEVRRFLYRKLEAKSVGKKISVRDARQVVAFQTHKSPERKKVLRIFDELVRDEHMTFQEARDEFFRAFPEARAADSPSPRRLLTSLLWLCEEIEAFDVDSFKTSKRRGKAQGSDVRNAITRLMEALQDLQDRMDG